MARLREGDTRVFEAPSRIFVSHETQTKADMMRSSIDQGVQIATGNEAHHLCSHPHSLLVSDEGETDRQGPHDSGLLSDTINDVGEGGTSHR